MLFWLQVPFWVVSTSAGTTEFAVGRRRHLGTGENSMFASDLSGRQDLIPE